MSANTTLVSEHHRHHVRCRITMQYSSCQMSWHLALGIWKFISGVVFLRCHFSGVAWHPVDTVLWSSCVQAVWRGHRERRRIKDKKVHEVRKKVQEATKNVKEENKLYYRTSTALDFLLTYRQLSHVLQALIHLGLLWHSLSFISLHILIHSISAQ